MLKIEELNKYFNKNRRNEIHVINNTTLTFDDVGLVCILGESGSGKTTLLNTMGGLDSFSGGTITVDDTSLKKYSPGKMDRLRNRKYGYIFQNYYLLSDYTVEYNIMLALKCLHMDPNAIEERVNYVLEAVEMRKYKKKLVSELSGGQRQRVSIARALAKTPDVIFADEPTGNLDENNTLRIMSILKKVSKNCLVILVTHERRIAEFFADRIICVRDGSVTEDKINTKSSTYTSSDDTSIYLKELDKNDLAHGDSHISIYNDGSAFPVKLDMVFSDGRLYISGNSNTKIEYLDETSEKVLVDDVKPEINMEEIDNFDFNLEKASPSGHNRLSLKELWTMACYNIKNVRAKQIFMYIVFVISSVLMLLSLSDFYRVATVKPYEVVTADSHYVIVNCEKLFIAKSAYNRFITESGLNADRYSYKKLWLTITSNNYAQLRNVDQVIKNFSYVDIKNLQKEDLLYGRMPENEYEIVIDKAVLEGVLNGDTILATILDDVSDFLNETASYNAGDAEFVICGISDNNEMSVYLSPDWIIWSEDSQSDQYYLKNFQLYTDTPEAVAEYFNILNKEYVTDYGEENKYMEPVISATYVYGDEMAAYNKEVKDSIQVRTIITGVIFIISIVVLAFTMKANSLRRTEELVVYRLIGITPGNIIMSYIIEVFIITFYTQMLPIAATSAVCKFLSGVNAFEMLDLCPWYYILLLLAGTLIVNICVSVLSIMGIIKRPPARLAAKN